MSRGIWTLMPGLFRQRDNWAGPCRTHGTETWSPETVRAYDRDSEIAWLDVGDQCAIPAIHEAGYYVMPHCAPECLPSQRTIQDD